MPYIGCILTPIEFGGSERVNLTLLENLDRDKFRVLPILLMRPWEPDGFFIEKLASLEYSFYKIPVAKKPRKQGRDYFRVIRCFILLVQVLRQERVDLIGVREPGLTDEEIKQCKEYLEGARAWLDRCGKKGDLLLREGDRPQDVIVEEAGVDSVVVMGASLKHDVHHRVRGSLPLQILSKTESSLLLAKLPPELGIDFFQELDTC